MKTLPQIIACIALGLFLGLAFWICDGGKLCKKVSEGLERASQAQEMPVNVYRGQRIEDIKQIGCWWSSSYLEVSGK